MSCLSTLCVGVLGILLYDWSQRYIPLEPLHYELPKPPHAPTDPDRHLETAEHLFINEMPGPEAFATSPDGTKIFTGLSDGRIVSFPSGGGGSEENKPTTFETVVRTGSNMPLCGTPDGEPYCGRPLGMQFDPTSGRLIVCDATRGLLTVDIETKSVKVLVSRANGRHILFPNALDIGEDGTIYFTDSSTRFPRRDVIWDLMESQPTGRLLAYYPDTSRTSVLLEGIGFANGVSLTSDGTSVLIAATSRAEIWKYDISTGNASVLVDNLAGWPDNIRRRPNKTSYWVGCSGKRMQPFSLMDFLSTFPKIRYWMAQTLRPDWVVKILPNYGIVLEVSQSGTVLRALHDIKGKTSFISEVHEVGTIMYLGSWRNNFLAQVATPPDVAKRPKKGSKAAKAEAAKAAAKAVEEAKAEAAKG